MKRFSTFVFVLFTVLCCALSAAADDVHYTCSSDPAMLVEQRYENLYLDVEGCGEDVVLENVTITGNLVYNGGKDVIDHHLSLITAFVENFFMPCESSHSCYLKIDNKDYSMFSYVPHNLTVMPSGREKGKIYITGVPESVLGTIPEIWRLNFIVDKLNDDYSNILYNGYKSFESKKISIPAGLPDNASLNGIAEIELSNIKVEQFSIVNKSQSAIASVSMNQDVLIKIMSALTPSLKLYSYEKKGDSDKIPTILSFIGVTDGDEMELSMDFAQIVIAHFLGNNNNGSKLNLKIGYEKHLRSSTPAIVNLFLFGASMDVLGYFTPDKNNMDVRRVIITEQPQDYYVNASPSLLAEFLEKYGETYFKNELRLTASRYEKYLDINKNSRFSVINLFSELSERYARNYPGSSTNWQPHFNLSYASIGKAICAQSITEKTSALSMFTFVTDSYMTLHDQPARYVMQDGLTASLAENPTYGGIELLPGCHTYAVDPKTGRLVVID